MEFSVLSAFCVILVTLLIVVFREGLSWLIFYLTTDIPGPSVPELAKIFSDVLINDNFFEVVIRLCSKYQYKPFGLWIHGWYVVAVSDAETLSEIFKNNKIVDKSDLFYELATKYIGNGMVTTNGADQKRHRKNLGPAFGKYSIESTVPLMNKHAKKTVELLREEAHGKSVDIREIIEEGTFCSGLAVLTAGSCEYSGSLKFYEVIKRVSSLVFHRLLRPFYGPLYCLQSSTRETEDMLKVLKKDWARTFSGGVSQSTTTETEQPPTYLKLAMKEFGEDCFSHEDFYSKLMQLMIASSDTTGLTVNAFLLVLALYPDVQQRLHEEVEDVLGEDPRHVEPEDLLKMKYLDLVCKEVLRLFSAVPFIAKKVPEDTKVGSVVLPKGSEVGICIAALHRDPKYFKDPLKFDPDRFLPENSEGQHPYAFLPFSAGVRNCPGQRHAYVATKTFVCHLVRSYKFLPGDDLKTIDDIKFKMSIFLHLTGSSLRLISRHAK